MIKPIVDRCHVGDTNRQVIRYLISRIKRGYVGWRALEKDNRKEIMREAFRVHQENRELYAFVMSGYDAREAHLKARRGQ
jgi:hypothetical protein